MRTVTTSACKSRTTTLQGVVRHGVLNAGPSATDTATARALRALARMGVAGGVVRDVAGTGAAAAAVDATATAGGVGGSGGDSGSGVFTYTWREMIMRTSEMTQHAPASAITPRKISNPIVKQLATKTNPKTSEKPKKNQLMI